MFGPGIIEHRQFHFAQHCNSLNMKIADTERGINKLKADVEVHNMSMIECYLTSRPHCQ